MGENWMGIWIFSFIGLFIIAVVIYDCLDRKKRKQEIKLRKYLPAVIVGSVLMLPILSGVVMSALWLVGLPL